MASEYCFKVTIPNAPFDDVLARTREALAEQGFGVPTEMNTQAIFKSKLQKDTERRIILGACQPHTALEALQIEPNIAVLLPCNVVVRELPAGGPVSGCEVVAIAPSAMFGLTTLRDPAMYKPVEQGVRAVLDAVASAFG